MKLQATRDLYAYWERLRGAAAAPARAAVDPVAIRPLLNDVFMLACDRTAGFPIRLAGARVCELFLNDRLKDSPFVDLFHENDRDTVEAILGSVSDDPTPVVAGVRAGPGGREPLDLELLVLPLGPLHTPQARILGSLTAAHRRPWVGLMPAEPMRLVSLRVLGHAVALSPPARALDADGWATLPLGELGRNRGMTVRRPNLTLYNG